MIEAMMRCRQLGNHRAAALWASRATECARNAFGTDSSAFVLYNQLAVGLSLIHISEPTRRS
eukprot:683229-Prymnesium_polylepis.2